MAGIQALINQANGGRQGMPGYIYYALANAQYTASPTACNSSSISSANCPFQDITAGTTWSAHGQHQPVRHGNTFCRNLYGQHAGEQDGVHFGARLRYGDRPGFGERREPFQPVEQRTFQQLEHHAGLSSTNFNFGTNVTLTGTVAGSGTPTGDVAFIVTQGVIGDTYNTETGALNGSVAFATLSGGSYSAF